MSELQNVFDDPDFFDGYMALRGRDDNMNELIEQPEMKKLVPVLEGKSVLDLGCGFGANCADFVKAGAKRVVGVDISERMLAVARTETGSYPIEYRRMDMTQIDSLNETFDLIYSSLAFHYVEDFGSLAVKLYDRLNDGGVLLFSQEHPLNTAGGHYNTDENGNTVSFSLYDYSRPGKREESWFVDGVVKYHRTLGGILDALANAGFVIERVVEPIPSAGALEKRPSLEKQFIRPCFLVVRAAKRSR